MWNVRLGTSPKTSLKEACSSHNVMHKALEMLGRVNNRKEKTINFTFSQEKCWFPIDNVSQGQDFETAPNFPVSLMA